ncbi:hypothetical protein EI94DRAFT_1749075 [Lactarius quietus]|nr:hypothetical protein EI94DRAFT_1749075 [Lactarius quietus]
MRALSLFLLQVFLATACFATPSKRQGVPASAVPSFPTGLGPQPTTSLTFVTLAVGTYNASCDTETGSFAPVAALAQVFDITSLYNGPFFNNIQQLVYNNIWNPAASNDPLDPNVFSQIQNTYGLERLGVLSYIDVSGGTQVPVLDFRQATNNPNYIFVGNISADVPSSDDPTTDADWQRWDATPGSSGLANSVYLINTLGGQLNSADPGACNPSNPGLLTKFVGVCWGFQ